MLKTMSPQTPWCHVFLILYFAIATATDLTSSPDETLSLALGLKTSYNKDARPPPTVGTANLIGVFFNLHNLVRVNSATEEMTLQVWFNLYWMDSRLAWREKFNSTFDNVSSIFVPANLLWQPDVAFYDLLDFRRTSSDNIFLVVESNGLVKYTVELLTQSKCAMNMASFPYDTQSCRQLVSSVVHTTDTIKLKIRPTKPEDSLTTYLDRNNDFCITNVSTAKSVDVEYEYVELRIDMKRRTTFYMVNLIVPSLLLLAISTLAFRLPPECGERMSLSVTIVLSMCVFLQLTGNYTPTQGDCVPLLTWFFSLAVLLTMANLVANAFVLNCHFELSSESGRVPGRLTRLLFLNRFVFVQRMRRDSSEARNCEYQSPQATSTNGRELSVISLRRSAKPSSQTAEQLPHRLGNELNCNDWSAVVAAADRCFFGVFLGLTLVLALTLAILEAANSRASCIIGREK